MVAGGISIKTFRLMMAILALGIFLVASGSAIDYGEGYTFNEGQSDYGSESMPPAYGDAQTFTETSAGHPGGSKYGHDNENYWSHGDRSWNNHEYDWLSPGGSYYWWQPTTYYYDWYYTPIYSTYYYSTPVYYDWNIDPWWNGHKYGLGSTSYYSSSYRWSYSGGFGF
jgi:hypothetical protein